jgi:hypothetical protein
MSLTTESDAPVVFEIDGVEVSNDPRWHEQQELTRLQAILTENANRTVTELKAAATAVTDAVKASKDGQHKVVEDLTLLTVPELKQMAEDRKLSLEGIKKKSQLVALLEEDNALRAGSLLTGQTAGRILPVTDAPVTDAPEGEAPQETTPEETTPVTPDSTLEDDEEEDSDNEDSDEEDSDEEN